MKGFEAAVCLTLAALAAGMARPAGAEQVLRWASATEPLSFDPHAANHIPTLASTAQVYEPLVDFNSSYEIEPALAVAWKLINPTTWQFDLRRGVRFHDGTPYLAGSSLTLDCAIGNTVRFSGLPLETVIAMASTIPASYLGTTTNGTVHADWDSQGSTLHVRHVTP